MNAKLFVKELNGSLDKISDVTLSKIVGKMYIRPKKNQTSYRDELSSLINNYEMDNVEIGIFSFFDGYKVTENYMLFGKIEMDLLGVDRKTREILLIDHDNLDHVMIKCSKDSASFLQVLNLYGSFTINRLNEQGGSNELTKKQLYELNGGNEYKQFIDFCFGNNILD